MPTQDVRISAPSQGFQDAFQTLAEKGWVRLQQLPSAVALLDVAASLGTPTRAPGGEVERVLQPHGPAAARINTLSRRYGTGPFPFHTDTAFWPIPCRYIVMRVEGDRRRSTLLLDFPALLNDAGGRALDDALRAVWRTPLAMGGIYCSTRFLTRQGWGWRYDGDVMLPANESARRVAKILKKALTSPSAAITLNWEDTSSLIIDNWRLLHARAPAPIDERARLLHRIYVR